MVACSVCDCDITYRNNPDNYSFHRFPIDPEVKKKWLTVIGRTNWTPKENSSVCSKHFEEKYFRQRARRRILMKSAIPTRFVPVQLKLARNVTSYAYRDIIPPPAPSTTQEEISPPKNKILIKCSKLKIKLKEKDKIIRKLKARTKRMAAKIVSLQDKLNEHSRPVHNNIICIRKDLY